MTTVIGSVETEHAVEDIFECIPLGYSIFNDAQIQAKYYKTKNGEIMAMGDCPKIKVFPRTLTLYCKSKSRYFKIRWFYSKKINKIHLASGLNQDKAVSYISDLINYSQKHLNIISTGEIKRVLANGMAQAKLGINLYKLAKTLDDSHENYVYTPDTHASLKLYTENGTVSIHSTGKILYMGTKDIETLMTLHEYISKIGKEWDGVPILEGL